MSEFETEKEYQNEIAAQRRHENRCTACNGTGKINMNLPVPFSNGEISEYSEENCPICHGDGIL